MELELSNDHVVHNFIDENRQEIKYFCIFGERCSGTNLLKNLVEANFKIEYNDNICHKHFFGFSDLSNTDDTLFLCIVRNFYEWIMSFYEKQHHFNKSSDASTDNIKNFLTQEIHSYDTEGNEIIQDWNYVTGCPYENIFELRKYKNLYFTDVLPSKVKHHYLILYENISNITFQVNLLEKLEREFQLKKINNSFIPIYYNAQIYNNQNIKKAFVPKKFNDRAKKIGITPEILNLIDKNIDHEVEKKIKYDTFFFKNKFQFNILSKETMSENEKVKKKELELDNMIKNRNKKLLDSQLLKKMTLNPNKENEKETFSLMQKFESNSNCVMNPSNDRNEYLLEEESMYLNQNNISINQYIQNEKGLPKKKSFVPMKSTIKFVN